MTFRVEVGETLAGIFEANAVAGWGRAGTRAGVADGDVKTIAIAAGCGGDGAGSLAVGDAVADRVFNDGLQEEARNQAVQCGGVDLDVDVEAVGESGLFDG